MVYSPSGTGPGPPHKLRWIAWVRLPTSHPDLLSNMCFIFPSTRLPSINLPCVCACAGHLRRNHFMSETVCKRVQPTPRPEEIEKLNRRREQNRRAAQKFRRKKKERGKHLTEESQRLECDNNSLRSEISKLNKERDELLQILSEHVQLCHSHQNNSNPPPP
ncbi:hypothetical protein ACOMHN_026572 [Nucella lapillus]